MDTRSGIRIDRRAALRKGALLIAGAVAAPALAALGACAAAGPRPIAFGHDECAYCRMVVTDSRFAAALLTAKGRTLVFDSAECLASYCSRQLEGRGRDAAQSIWVSDHDHPGQLIPARRARFLRLAGPGSPMGKGLVAFRSDADAHRMAEGAAPLGWDEVLALVGREGLRRGIAANAWPVMSAVLLLLAGSATPASAQQAIVVSPDGPVRTVAAAIARAPRGGRIRIAAGTYREPTINVDKPITIVGDSGAVLDGEGKRQIMTIAADSVTIRGLTFRDVATSYRDDWAAIKVVEANDCVIENNHIERAFFGIYLARVSRCVVAHNVLEANRAAETTSGNGIHLWTADHVTIADNRISGHRDGIYFEFVHNSTVERNLSEGNARYGLHFMFSDDCRYVGNIFRRNGAGVAVMYTRHVEMVNNRFEENWGGAAYGLLLKEISDPRLEGNRFIRNTTGLLADGTTRLVATHNTFADNGWAIRLDANAQEGRIAENDFIRNSFDITTNSRNSDTVLEGNYWDSYAGYDLQRDGRGDVPYHPVRLFSLLVEQNEPALILLRSNFVALLDAAERVIPALTPETLVDRRPAMRPLSRSVR